MQIPVWGWRQAAMRFGVIISSAAVAIMCATPVVAQDRGAYVGVDIGAAFGSDLNLNVVPGTTPGTTGRLEASQSMGHQASAAIGYDLGRYRLEVEALRSSSSIDEVTADGLDLPGAPTSGRYSANGDLRATSYMANVVLDVGDYQGFEVFGGAGIGITQLEIADMGTSGGQIVNDSEESDRTTWQLFAGVRRQLSSRIDAQLRYRFMHMAARDDILIGYSGRVMSLGDLSQHSVSVGLMLRF